MFFPNSLKYPMQNKFKYTDLQHSSKDVSIKALI